MTEQTQAKLAEAERIFEEEGASRRDVAARLHISVNTLRTYLPERKWNRAQSAEEGVLTRRVMRIRPKAAIHA